MKSKAVAIQINISGPVQTGKSAILSSIKEMLTDRGYCVAIPEREERLNPSETLDTAPEHERPEKDKTVIIITESLGCR